MEVGPVLPKNFCQRMKNCGAVVFFLAIAKGALALEEIYDRDLLKESALDFEDLVRKEGYPAEVHKVATRDDYILTLHRIPHGPRCGPGQPKKPPVLMMHGLLSNSRHWLVPGPGESLAYILADLCYDVWLGNNRGNAESREHRTLTTKNRAFWDFSWHEMGKYDVPALIEHILNATNEGSLHYIGHSQGMTQFFVFSSLYPELTNKIRCVQALGPVAYLKYIKNPMGRHAIYRSALKTLYRLVGPIEFLPLNDRMTDLGRRLSSDKYPVSQAVIFNLIFGLIGFDAEGLNSTRLPFVVGPRVRGGSLKNVVHYIQNKEADRFQQFDYSSVGNRRRYGTNRPPEYNLQNVRTPIALYHGSNDWFVDERDFERLAGELPNVIAKILVPRIKFNHNDYLWSVQAKDLFYGTLLDIMSRH